MSVQGERRYGPKTLRTAVVNVVVSVIVCPVLGWMLFYLSSWMLRDILAVSSSAPLVFRLMIWFLAVAGVVVALLPPAYNILWLVVMIKKRSADSGP